MAKISVMQGGGTGRRGRGACPMPLFLFAIRCHHNLQRNVSGPRVPSGSSFHRAHTCSSHAGLRAPSNSSAQHWPAVAMRLVAPAAQIRMGLTLLRSAVRNWLVRTITCIPQQALPSELDDEERIGYYPPRFNGRGSSVSCHDT